MTFVMAVQDTLQSNSSQGEWTMDDYPSTDYILANWWTTNQSSQKLGISRQAVVDACKRNPDHEQYLRSKLIGLRWYIDPESIEQYPRRFEG